MLEKYQKIARAALRCNPVIVGVLLLSCLIGIAQAVRVNAGEWDSPAALMLLALSSVAMMMPQLDRPLIGRHGAGWCVLLLSLGLLYLGIRGDSEIGKSGALLLILAGIILFAGGWACAMRSLWPLAASLLLLPFQENWTLFCSYPLRLISTILSVSLFDLCGVEISSELTTIRLGKAEIAITDACSGISQLGVLLFFAYILSLTLRCRPGAKILWILFVLPIVILANTVRLIITIGLFLVIGEQAFANTLHILLGYFFVIFSILLLWWSRRLIPAPGEEAPES